VSVAAATVIPACTLYVDAASAGAADGTVSRPYRTIGAGVAAASDGAIICVAEGTYAEAIRPELKPFTLAGGFATGRSFAVRDSSRFVSRARGDGTSSFLRIDNEGPRDGQLTAVDGFEITGYSQAIVRDVYYSQRFDITSCYIHDNTCASASDVGAAFALVNVSGTIRGNVIARNRCSRGGGGFIGESLAENAVTITGNWIDANEGDEAGGSSHGGGLYLLVQSLDITANLFTGNRTTGWGGGLYVGADTPRGLHAVARLSWNVYRDNRAGDAGGGFFCDDAARCTSDHEIYDSNCGGNVFLDSSPTESDPTIASFDHLTSYRGLAVGCGGPGPGVVIVKNNIAPDAYSFTRSIFWGNAAGREIVTSCTTSPGVDCSRASVSVTESNFTTYFDDGIAVTFGAGNAASGDPRFVDPAARDFHLQSTRGHWTPGGFVTDAADSPALATAGRSELGAYGDSVEASR